MWAKAKATTEAPCVSVYCRSTVLAPEPDQGAGASLLA
jgi:hypothetical protein